MSALDAAVMVLKDAGGPLHYREITQRILATGRWTTKGKTPEATVNAQIGTDIKKRGQASRFVRTGPGIFAINARVGMGKKAPPRARLKKTPKPRGRTKLSFTEAGVRILEAAHAPMHYRDITAKALEQDLLNTEGKTPDATMYAQILQEVQRRKRRGEQQRYMILGKGMITLSRWQAQGLAFQVGEANRKARSALLKQLKAMPPTDFEDLVGRLLAELGFEDVEITARSKDGGIDVRGTLVVGDVIRIRLAVQVKRWKNNVQAPVVQQVRGSLGAHEQGLIITTSDFGKGARTEAERPDATPVGLMNGEQFVALLVENELGVRRTPLQLIELGEAEDSVERGGTD